MKKEKLEEFFNNINNAEDLIMYHLFKRGWKFVNVFKSGIMTKGNVFFVIKKYASLTKTPMQHQRLQQREELRTQPQKLPQKNNHSQNSKHSLLS